MSHHFEANTYLALGVIVLHVSSVKKKTTLTVDISNLQVFFQFQRNISHQTANRHHRWSSFTLRKTKATTN